MNKLKLESEIGMKVLINENLIRTGFIESIAMGHQYFKKAYDFRDGKWVEVDVGDEYFYVSIRFRDYIPIDILMNYALLKSCRPVEIYRFQPTILGIDIKNSRTLVVIINIKRSVIENLRAVDCKYVFLLTPYNEALLLLNELFNPIHYLVPSTCSYQGYRIYQELC